MFFHQHKQFVILRIYTIPSKYWDGIYIYDIWIWHWDPHDSLLFYLHLVFSQKRVNKHDFLLCLFKLYTNVWCLKKVYSTNVKLRNKRFVIKVLKVKRSVEQDWNSYSSSSNKIFYVYSLELIIVQSFTATYEFWWALSSSS